MSYSPQSLTGALKRQFKELEILHAVGLMCVELTDEDELIEAFTALIGEAFFPDNFGVFLWSQKTGRLCPHKSYRLTGDAVAFPSINPQEGIIGKVAASGQLFHSGDIQGESDYLLGDPKTRSELCVPLKAGEKLIGVVNAESHQTYAFNDTDERLLVTLAAQLGTAIANARLFSETHQQNLELSALYETAIATSSLIEADSLFENLALHVNQLLKSDTFLVARYEPSEHEFEFDYALDRGRRLDEIEADRTSLEEGGLIGWVLENRQSLFVADMLRAELPVPPRHLKQPARSWIGVPMIARAELIGALAVQSYQPNAFNHSHKRFLESVASQFAISLHNARMYTAARRNADQLAILNDLAREMTGPVRVDELCDTFAHKLLQAFDYFNVAVLLLDDSGQELTVAGSAGAYQDFIAARNPRISLGQGIIGQAALKNEPIVVNDTRNDPHFYELGGQNIRSEMALPLRLGSKLIGILNVDSEHLDAFDASAAALICTVGDQLATAIEKARLFEETRQRALNLESQMQETKQRVQELTVLYEVGQEINSAPPAYEEISRIITRQFSQVIDLQRCSLSLLQSDQESLSVLVEYRKQAGNERFNPDTQGQVVRLADFPASDQALQNQEPLIVFLPGSQADPAARTSNQSEVNTSLMIMPVVVKGESIGIVELEMEPGREFAPEQINLAMTLANQIAIALDNARLYAELEDSYVEIVVGLAAALDARDNYTGDHSKQLGRWVVAIAERMGCSPKEVQVIRWASLLHDIGKIGVPDEILRKPGPLTEEEWEMMRKHPELGAEILAPFKQLADVIPLIRSHQEKYDGSGYPDGLAGEQIPLGARILAVVDAYSAITDERVYSPAQSHREAVVEITRSAGTHFDPNVVEAFLEITKDIG